MLDRIIHNLKYKTAVLSAAFLAVSASCALLMPHMVSYASWTDAQRAVHEDGTYTVTIPTLIKYENMNAGSVDVSDAYFVNAAGSINKNYAVEISASADSTLANGTSRKIKTSFQQNKSEWTPDELSTASSGKVVGTSSSDAVRLLGTADSVGEYIGSISYISSMKKVKSTVKFDGNGGSDGSPVDIKIGDKIGTLPNSTRAGYISNGWYTEKDGGTKITADTAVPYADTVYYAQWKPYYLTVQYMLNGGELADPHSSLFTVQDGVLLLNGSTNHSVSNLSGGSEYQVKYGERINLCDTDSEKWLNIARKGYHLEDGKEWCLTSDGFGKTFNDSYTYASTDIADTSASDQHVLLYANWKPNAYTVSFEANGGEGTMEDESMKYDLQDVLTSNAFTREGYKFEGWALSSDGAVQYTDGQSVKNLTDSGTAVLYAVWTKNTYTIAYEGENTDWNWNDADVSKVKHSYSVTDSDYIVPTPEKKGYTFLGWDSAVSSAKAAFKTLKLYTSKVAKRLSLVTGPRKAPAPTASGLNPYTVPKGSVGNIDLTPSWKLNTYSIGYTLNGGTVSDNPASYTFDTASFTLKAPTRNGFTFQGWTGSNGAVPQTSITIAKGSIGNRNYTANYTSNNNMASPSTLSLPAATYLGNGKYRVQAESWSGLCIPHNLFTANHKYEITYRFQKASGTLTGIAGHHDGFQQNEFLIDGVNQAEIYMSPCDVEGSPNYHDVADDNAVHTVKFVCTASSEFDQIWIQPNRGPHPTACECEVWDINVTDITNL